MRQSNIHSLKMGQLLEDGPLVSIVVPVYNTPEKLLRMAVDSILAQTYTNIELLIVDDGSGPTCKEAISAVAALDARVRILEGGRCGASHARNIGISAAKGDWLAFSDSDDEVGPSFISEGLSVALKERCDFVCGSVVHLYLGDAKDANSATGEYWIADDASSVWAAKMQMLGTQKYSVCDLPNFRGRGPIAKLFRKSVLGDLRFDEGISIGEDTLFNYQFIGRCQSLAVVDCIWYWYYQYGNSTVHAATPLKWISSFDCLMAYRPTSDERIAFDARCASLIMEGSVNFLAVLGLREAYKISKVLYEHARDNGWITSCLFEGYTISGWMRLYASCLENNRFELAFLLCVAKQLKNRLRGRQLIGVEE